MVHNIKMQAHMMHMRYLVYRDALRAAHKEITDYSTAMSDLIARNAKDLD